MTGEIAWLAAGIIAGGIVTGILAGLFGIGGGAVIVPVLYEVFRVVGVPNSVRMQLCLGTSMAIIVPTTLRSSRAHKVPGIGASRGHATLGAAVDAGRCGRFGSRGDCASRYLQGGVCHHRMCDRREASDWRRTLGRWHRTARSSGDDPLWLCHWLGLLTDGDRRRFTGDDGADPLRQADPQRSSDRGGPGCADYGRRHDWLYPRRPAAFDRAATIVVRIRIGDRPCPGCAALELGCTVRCPLWYKLPKRKLEVSFALFLLLVAARFLASLLPAI